MIVLTGIVIYSRKLHVYLKELVAMASKPSMGPFQGHKPVFSKIRCLVITITSN